MSNLEKQWSMGGIRSAKRMQEDGTDVLSKFLHKLGAPDLADVPT